MSRGNPEMQPGGWLGAGGWRPGASQGPRKPRGGAAREWGPGGDWWLGVRAGGRGLGAGGSGGATGWELGVEDWRLGAAGWRLGAAGWGLGLGLGAESDWGLGWAGGPGLGPKLNWKLGPCRGAGRAGLGAGGWDTAATHPRHTRTRERFANALATIPGQRLDPWTPTFKTGTLLLRIREKVATCAWHNSPTAAAVWAPVLMASF